MMREKEDNIEDKEKMKEERKRQRDMKKKRMREPILCIHPCSYYHAVLNF